MFFVVISDRQKPFFFQILHYALFDFYNFVLEKHRILKERPTLRCFFNKKIFRMNQIRGVFDSNWTLT